MNQENTPTSESGAAGNDHPAAEAPERSVAVDLQAEIEALQAQLQEARDDYLRAQAEVQNIRRRAEEDRIHHSLASERLLHEGALRRGEARA